jgi:hypothetical protein
MKWRIANNSQCNFCGQNEDYLHYFISNPYLKESWVKYNKFWRKKKIKIENVVTVKHIIFGYKIFDEDYFDFNYFFNKFRIFYIQYKAYYVSEQKTKQVSIYSLFVREYITRISQVQKLQNSKLLTKINKNIEMQICICICVCMCMHACICVYVGIYL